MTAKKPFLVTVEAVVRMEIATEASSRAEATRNVREQELGHCEAIGAPERVSVRVLRVREVDDGDED